MQAPTEVTFQDLSEEFPDKNVLVFNFAGQLDQSNIDEKSKKIQEVIFPRIKNLFLIFNFAQLEYLNSKSIGYITCWHNQIMENEGCLMITNLRPNVEDLLNCIGLNQVIKFFLTLDEAKLAVLKAKAPAEIQKTSQAEEKPSQAET